MPYVDVNDVTYHAHVRGSGAPIVFLHGFTGCSENWQPIIESLTEHKTSIAINLMGHGKTECPADPTRYRMEHAAKDLLILIRQLVGEPVHLVGYSMGGRLALYFAIHYPQWITRLTLESASPGLADPAERDKREISDDQLAQRIMQVGIKNFVEEWEALPLFDSQKRLPAAVRAALREQRLKNSPQGLANSLRGMGLGVQPSLWEHLSQITCPTDLIVGSLDPKITAIAQHMRAVIADCKLTIIPNAGHTVHLEQPARFIHAIRP